MLCLAFEVHGQQPRIALLHISENSPPAAEVQSFLEEHLAKTDIDVTVDLFESNQFPENSEQWFSISAKAAEQSPGTVAMVGYRCSETTCALYLCEPRDKTLTEIPVEFPKDKELTLAFALAATAREAILGPLFPELKRLVNQGKAPSPPPPSPENVWIRPPLEDERKRENPDIKRPWLWLEGGYHGDHPHTDGHPIHGPMVGVVAEPRRAIAVALSIGWLGIRKGDVDLGKVTSHRLTSSLALRIKFQFGPAHIAIAPVGRFDVVFAQIDPVGEKITHQTGLEIQAGGITMWHLPLGKNFEAVIGAGVLASVLSKNYGITLENTPTQVAIPASILRIIWMAGVSWSPLIQ